MKRSTLAAGVFDQHAFLDQLPQRLARDVRVKLDADQQPVAADVGDVRPARRAGRSASAQVVADLLGVAGQILLERLADHGQRHRRRQRVAAERRAVVAVREDADASPWRGSRRSGRRRRGPSPASSRPARRRTARSPRACRAARRPVWTSSKISTRLLLVAPVAQALEVLARWQVDAALALDRLDHDGAGLVGGRLLDASRSLNGTVARKPAGSGRILLVGRLAGRGRASPTTARGTSGRW